MNIADPFIRILIAGNQTIVLEGLGRLLEGEEGFKVVGEAGNPSDLFKSVEQLKPDILLLDLDAPEIWFQDALQQLLASSQPVRAILLMPSGDRARTVQFLQWGVRGIVLKRSSTQLLFQAVRSVAEGQYWIGH